MLGQMTKRELELIEEYYLDPAGRWEGTDELKVYLARTPLDDDEAIFFEELLHTMEVFDALRELSLCGPTLH